MMIRKNIKIVRYFETLFQYLQSMNFICLNQIQKIWSFKMGGVSIAITKGLPYGIFMKHVIYDITEKGHLFQMKKHWKTMKPDCTPLINTGKPLSMEKLSTAFIITLSGIALALVSLLLEIVLKSSITRPSQQNDISKNDQKLRFCLNKLKASNVIARYPELINLIADAENYLEFDRIQSDSMY